MGQSQSSVTVNQLSKTISTIAMNTVENCQVASTQNQSTTVANSGFTLFGSYTMQQQTTISSTCFQNTALQAQLQNSIIQAIKQATTATGQSIMSAFGSSSSSANTNLTTIIQNSVTMSNIQNNYNAVAQNQTISFTNSGVIGFQQSQLTQGSQIFAASTLKALDDAGVFNTISNSIDQTSTAQGASLFDLGSLFSGLSGFSQYLVIFFFIVIVYVAYRYYTGKKAEPKVKVTPVIPAK